MPKKISRETLQKIKSAPTERVFTFEREAADDEQRTVPVSISSEKPYKRFFGNEVLVHEKSAIDMERAGGDNGLPLRIDHRGKLIGRVRNIKLKNKRLVGVAHFSENSVEAREAWSDVRDGFLTDTSVQYDVVEISESFEGDDTVRVTRWRPVEAAVVAVPADNSVGISRSKSTEDKTMPEGKKGDELTLVDFEAARTAGHDAGQKEGAAAATQRVTSIYRSFEAYLDRDGVKELRDTCIDQDTSAMRANELLLELIAKDPEPVQRAQSQSKPGGSSDIETIKDESENWVDGVSRALEVRANLIADKEVVRQERSANEFVAMSLQELARDYLVRQRVKVAGLDRMALVGQSFVRAGQFGTSDFANVLGNTASKAMLIGFEEAPETWREWCRVGSLSDFKVADRVNISSFSDLEEVLESEEYQRGAMSDLKETIQLGTYGKMFPISRQAIINDDLNAFTQIPRKMGRAANAKVGDLAYNLLIDNSALNQDGTALFDAGHNNLGTPGAISETTLDEFGQLMYAQTSPAPRTGETGRRLNIEPRHLLVPRNLLNTALKVTNAAIPPGETAFNTQRGQWNVITDGRLGADSTTEYYALADQNVHDTFEIAFLDGVDEPFLDSEDGWDIDGVEYKVRIDAAAAVLDFRGACRNATS